MHSTLCWPWRFHDFFLFQSLHSFQQYWKSNFLKPLSQTISQLNYVNIKIAVLRWEKTNKLECNNEKKTKATKTKTISFFDFSTFSQTPHHISISVSFSLVTIDLTLFPSLHFTRWMKEWSSLFFVWNIFNIFWQCLLEFFKKNEQIRTGCCLQCMLGQDTNHHPSATSYVWLALTAKGQRDSHVSPFCLTKTAVYVLRSSVLQNKLPHVQHDWMGPYRLQWLRSIVQILAWNPCCNKFDKNANV